MIQLRPYQTDALTAIERAAALHSRQIVQLATGLGKTVVFAELIRRRGGRALVLVHRDELVRQTVDKLAMVAPGLSVGVLKAERDEHQAEVIVASVQTLARPARLSRIDPRFDTVVIDECHHMAADSYQRILTALDTPLALGVTATPWRTDGQPLCWPVTYQERHRLWDSRGLPVRSPRPRSAAQHRFLGAAQAGR